MEFIDSHLFRQWAIQSLVVLFFVGGLVGFVAGACLIFCSERTLRVFDALNRWVSMRNVSKPFELPRDTTRAVQKYRRWLAAFFIAGAVFSIFVLATKFDARAVISGFSLNTLRAPVASWIVESARWLLIVGNLVAIAVGIMLGFFPAAITALEASGGRWYSERRLTKVADAMNLSLDRWVAAFPRTAGVIFMLTTLILVGNFGFILFGLR